MNNLWETALAAYRQRKRRAHEKHRLVGLEDEPYTGDFDELLNARCFSAYNAIGHPTPAYHTGRQGMHTPQSLGQVAPHFWTVQWRMAMAVSDEMIQEQIEALQGTLDRYHDLTHKFRGEVKNDISSVKAQAVATEETVNRIGKAYAATARLLTTPEFERALSNAERMAAALKAISDLNSHSITFAVLDTKAQT